MVVVLNHPHLVILKLHKQALKENPEIDEFIIYIGGKERNGISPDESILIWDIYKTIFTI